MNVNLVIIEKLHLQKLELKIKQNILNDFSNRFEEILLKLNVSIQYTKQEIKFIQYQNQKQEQEQQELQMH